MCLLVLICFTSLYVFVHQTAIVAINKEEEEIAVEESNNDKHI